MRYFFLIALAALVSVSVRAADSSPQPFASLVAKGLKFKAKDQALTEVSVPASAEMTLDDYRELGQIKTLTSANFGSTKLPLNDETAAALSGLDRLERVFANGAELSDEGFKQVAAWRSLKHLGLDHWGWKAAGKGTLGDGLRSLAGLPNLESIRLGGCKIDDKAAAALATVKTLQSVDVQHAFGLNDDGVGDLATLPKLRVIRLNPQFSPKISDASLRHLGKAATLEEIEVDETWLTYGDGFVHLKPLARLKKVTLTRVLAEDEDVARLKADHPEATVTWTKPPEEMVKKLTAAFEKARRQPTK